MTVMMLQYWYSEFNNFVTGFTPWATSQNLPAEILAMAEQQLKR